jgi:glycolate oxidase
LNKKHEKKDNLEEMLVLAVNHSFLYEKLESIVGSENVTDKEIIMEAYTASALRERTLGGVGTVDKVIKPGFIVRAGSKEEVQEIVRLANEYKVPIIPTGALTSEYSGTVPTEGGIMLDFSRMNKIEIDEELMTVTLEPGVTWAQAYRDLAVKGYWVCNQASPGSISILGTTSQAGMHMPFDKYAVLFGSYYCTSTIGMEVVLPTGELLVTGSAALPGAKPQRGRAYGPDVGHIFLGSQGTLGIVVKQTMPLWRIPEVRHVVTGLFTHENYKGLANSMHRIMYDQFKGPVWVERVSAFYDGPTRQEWELYIQLYGSKEVVEALRKFSERIITEEGGTVYPSTRLLEPETTQSPQMYEEYIFWRPRANSIIMPLMDVGVVRLGGGAHYQKIPELYDAMVKLFAKHGVQKSRIRRGLAGSRGRSATTQSTSLAYYYDPNDPEDVKRAEAVNEEWPKVYSEVTGVTYRGPFGGGFGGPISYRITPTRAKSVMPMLGEYYQLLKTLKRTLDPNRIMNPGKLMDIEPY